MTDVGLVRGHNEDCWASYPDQGFFILADGMGGHSGGEIASSEAVDRLYALFESWTPSDSDAAPFFEKAFSTVNSRIHTMGGENKELKGMGTTLCCLYLDQQEAVIAHVGDSRVYRLRETKLEQLTKDHSLVEELLSVGALSPDEATTFPYKHILTRAIGTQASVRTTINTVLLESHDLFMLCSDGLTNYITFQQIEDILSASKTLASKGKELINLANKQGGGDNITLILVETNNDLSRQ